MGELADYLAQHDANFRKARLPALYSDFRSQRTLNPDGYRANISAWRSGLSLLASSGLLSRRTSDSGAFVVEINDSLLRSLESRQFGQPLALGTAVREAVAARALVPLQDFTRATQSVYQRGWSEVPWSVMSWTLQQLGVIDPSRGEDKLPKGKFVMMENLEAAGKVLGDRIAETGTRFYRVFTKAQFHKEFAAGLVQDQRVTDTDLDVLLKFLSRDKQMIAYDGQTVRLKGAGEPGTITEEDQAIASVKELLVHLKHQADLLANRVDELSQAAQSAVSRKNRVAAMAALRSKKLAENSLSTRYATLNQLEEVASKIQQAVDQVALVKVMESSTGVLQNLNSQIGGVDRVDNVMEAMREQMSDTDEIASILAESNGASLDEGEIDDELEAMEREEKQKEAAQKEEQEEASRRVREAQEAAAAQKKLDDLPQVPVEEGRQKEQTPTTQTGIGDLNLGDTPHKQLASS